jgi:hypothetical protein
LSDGHGLIHVAIEGIALLSCEYIENLNTAVSLASGDILIVGIKADTKGLLQGVSQGVFVSHLYLRVLHAVQTINNT